MNRSSALDALLGFFWLALSDSIPGGIVIPDPGDEAWWEDCANHWILRGRGWLPGVLSISQRERRPIDELESKESD